MPPVSDLYIKLSKEQFNELFKFKNDKGYNTVRCGNVVFIEVSEFDRILGTNSINKSANP